MRNRASTEAAVIVLLVAIAAIVLAAAALLSKEEAPAPHSDEGRGGQRPVTIYYAPCLRREALQGLQEAARELGLALRPLPPEEAAREAPLIYVGDAAYCDTRTLAQAVAEILSRGGTTILIGRPRQVSWVFKNETKVLMIYPLPATNETIIYAVRVRGYRHETMTLHDTVTTVDLAVPEIKYRIGLGKTEARDVLRIVASWYQGAGEDVS